MPSQILVCPVAYNENEKLRRVIERFLKTPAREEMDFLIVDDCSSDGTTEMIRSYKDRGVETLRHDRRRGVGAAIRTAIEYARHNGYAVLVIMAGNDKDDPDEIPLLTKPLIEDQADFVQGSRYVGGARAGGDMPLYRKMATRLHPFLMSFFTGRHVTDSTNGFRAFRLSLFEDEKINIAQDWLDAYELEPYLLFKVIRLGYRFREVPVTKIYPSRKMGYTKMRPFVGWWSILKPVLYLGLGIKR